MKKRLVVLLAAPLFSGCVFFNTLGVGGSIPGSEAYDRIFQAALIGGLIAGGDFVSALLTDALTGIEDGAYYSESEVETCEQNLQLISPFLPFGRILFLVSSCNIEPDGAIL